MKRWQAREGEGRKNLFTDGQIVNVDLLYLFHHLLHVGLCQLLHGGLRQQVGEVDVIAPISWFPDFGCQQLQALLEFHFQRENLSTHF